MLLRSQSLGWHGHLRCLQLDTLSSSSSGRGNGRGSIIVKIIEKKRRRNCKWRRCSLEKKEGEFEIDGAKAREALKQLDQQLQSLSQSQPQPPLPTKPKPPLPEQDLDVTRDFLMRRDFREDMPEISDSYLAYTAGALVLLTVFYNMIFSFYIKPSIDGYQTPVIIERVPLSEPKY